MGQHSAEVFQQDCATCGGVFEYKLSKNNRHRVFCSRPCFVGARRGVGRYQPSPRLFKQTTTCESCSASMPRKVHNARWCPTCVPDKSARARMMRYGVSHPVWLQMAARFAGKCWICRIKKAAVIDHDHATGTVRGALCQACNHALFAFEIAGWEKLAKAYLAERG